MHVMHEPAPIDGIPNVTDPCMESKSPLDRRSPVEAKVELFRSLFRSREDVYTRRLESRKRGENEHWPFCVRAARGCRQSQANCRSPSSWCWAIRSMPKEEPPPGLRNRIAPTIAARHAHRQE